MYNNKNCTYIPCMKTLHVARKCLIAKRVGGEKCSETQQVHPRKYRSIPQNTNKRGTDESAEAYTKTTTKRAPFTSGHLL